MRKSGLNWSFANNSATAYSQFLSSKSAQQHGGTLKQYPPGFSQRSLGLEKQHLPHAHPWQANDAQKTSQSKQMVSSAIKTSVVSSNLTTNPSNNVSSSISLVPVPPSNNGPVVGSTDLKSSTSISVGPCQLTLFYNGSVCVYDNISPEKAQAIMLLAGNGESRNSTASPAASLPSLPKVQPTMPRPLPAKDTTAPNLSVKLSSPISLLAPSPAPAPAPAPVRAVHAPATSAQIQSVGFSSLVSAGASTSAVELNPIKSVGNHVKCSDPPKSDAPQVKSIPKGSAVPQSRKASIARFLEKRKERTISTSPYVISKNISERNGGSTTFLANSTSPSPLPARN